MLWYNTKEITVCVSGAPLRLLLWYGRSDVFINVGLRNASLKGVLDCHVHPMDIFRLWDVAGGPDEVYIYHRIYSSLYRCLVVARGRGELDRHDPLFVHNGNFLALVQELLVLRTKVVHGTIHVVPRRRDDTCGARFVNDPTPTKSMSGTIID
jgi:hypothetical protein